MLAAPFDRMKNAFTAPPVLKRELAMLEEDLRECGYIDDHLPQELAQFYLACGGLSWNGLTIFAADEGIDDLPDIVSQNDDFEDMDLFDQCLWFGSRDGLLLVYDWSDEVPEDARWRILDRQFGDEIATFPDFLSLISHFVLQN